MTPTSETKPSASRSRSTYGGFAGTESSSQFNDRRPLERLTVLSGDIGTASDHSDNSYHVITADRVTNTALIDGFIVKHGNATDAPAPETGVPPGGGAGMQIIGDSLGGTLSSPVVLRITFTDNIADFGGAVYIYTGTGQNTNGPIFYNCEFRNNTRGDCLGLWIAGMFEHLGANRR